MTIYNILTYPTKSIRNAVSLFVGYFIFLKIILIGHIFEGIFEGIEGIEGIVGKVLTIWIILLAPWIILYYKFNTEIV
jgi:hypothetical protein